MSYYASEEIHELEKENLKLKQQLEKAIDALKFYADSDCYERFGRFDLSEIDEDNGEMAQEVLKELKNEP